MMPKISPETVICIAGKNQIAVDAVRYLIDSGYRKYLVVCCNEGDDGQSTWQPSLRYFANESGIPIVRLEELKELSSLIFVSLEFDKLLRPSVFKSQRLYNIHFSALPEYKGMFTSALPILHCRSHTGVTLHKIDSGIDTGDVIDQVRFQIADEWRCKDLYFEYLDAGIKLFKDNIIDLITLDDVPSVPQASKNASYYSKTAINYRDLSIDLVDTAFGIANKLRAFYFPEFQVPKIQNIFVGNWAISDKRSRKPAGTLENCGQGMSILSTLDYDLVIEHFRLYEWFDVTAEDARNLIDTKHINVRNKYGWTPLIVAAYKGDAKLCNLLLDRGADPNLTNLNGTTPMMYAMSGNSPKEVGQVLLDHGVDLDMKDLLGRDLSYYHPNYEGLIKCS